MKKIIGKYPLKSGTTNNSLVEQGIIKIGVKIPIKFSLVLGEGTVTKIEKDSFTVECEVDENDKIVQKIINGKDCIYSFEKSEKEN